MKLNFNKGFILDGAMGSLLLERAELPAGYPLELLNIENPTLIASVHRDYVTAGSDMISSNTFGANFYKFNDKTAEIIEKGINLAKENSNGALVAFDIGPLGKIIGTGGISKEEAYSEYARIVKAGKDNADYIVIETMTDLTEARIAALAALENSLLPVAVSMSFEKNGRTFFGNSVETFCETMNGLGISAIGINCSLGATEILPLAEKLLSLTPLPVFIKPNAGLPELKNGKTVYKETPLEFSLAMAKIKKLGINILGGCCGTSPEHIAELINKVGKDFCARAPYVKKSRICSQTKTVECESFKIVGERINPTGKKRLKQALRERDFDYICSLAAAQEKEGADILDVNAGIKDINERELLPEIVNLLMEATSLPLMIDTSDPVALEAALRTYTGKAIINSVNASEKSLNVILPIAKKYGAALVALTLDENGIPASSQKRLELAEKIIGRAKEFKIEKEDIFVDALTLAEASEKDSAKITLDTVNALSECRIKSVLGISNISFGMPNREDINAKFLELAIKSGLTLAIINPLYKGLSGSSLAEEFLLLGDADKYISANASEEKKHEIPLFEMTLIDAIVTGQKDQAKKLVMEILKNEESEDIPSLYIIPALDEIGRLYESGKVFLPQLIASAEAAKAALSALPSSFENESGKRFVIATVAGDIHDIGKNIVSTVVSNYGFKVIDLGRDVQPETILEAVKENYPCTLGLSALMTTTAVNMEKTIELVKKTFPHILILTGGAVITETYAKNIGGIYCKDAKATVDILRKYT